MPRIPLLQVSFRWGRALRAGFGDFGGGLLFFFLGRAAQMVFREAVAEESKSVFGGIHKLEQVKVLGSNRAGIDEGLEVHDAMPVFAAIDDNENLLGEFIGLGQREDFEEFVDCAEAAGKKP